MRAAGRAIAAGLRLAFRSWGIGVLLLAVNVAVALVVAVPLAATLDADFHERPAGISMLRGFDFPWWSRFADTTTGYAASLVPEILGKGFVFRNVDLLSRGQLPAALFAVPDAEGKRKVLLDPLLLTIGAAYMALQVFLAGGILGVLRQAGGGWTVRGLLHGAGFYFGRFARIALAMLLATAVVFALYGPLTRVLDERAREAVSERTAEAWLLGRHLVLLAGLGMLHLVGTYARIITVLEERTSAVLAVLSALSFALTHLLATVAVAGAMAVLFVAALWLFQLFDQAWDATGYRTLALTVLAMQAFVLARIQLRVALAGSLMDLYRARPS